MCGILGLVRPRSPGIAPTAPLLRATRLVEHRGPDDEGFFLWSPGAPGHLYAAEQTSNGSRASYGLHPVPDAAAWQVALGHRRLSIVDLSPAGFQPMIHRESGLAVVYNGEIYNHLELRKELSGHGYRFVSHSDTEVLLVSWLEWGPEALNRFNGMFSFLLLDPRHGGTLHAVRDRFGVKPLYWAQVGDTVAFASEIKQIRCLPGFRPQVDVTTASDYLVTGAVDVGRHTFDRQIQQLEGGERAVVRFDTPTPRPEICRWYQLQPREFIGTAEDAAAECRRLLTDSVALRLRADVPIGSCLSGGLDSSAIVTLASRQLDQHHRHAGQITVTARFDSATHDEWGFAEAVVRQTRAQSVQVWPSFDRLRADLDRLLWHMDEPFGSTSMFSQWCVFGAAAGAGLKVMLDGQGSDEQLAGYGGSDSALYTGLMRRGALMALLVEAHDFRQRHGRLPLAQLALAVRNLAPAVDRLLPERVRIRASPPLWLRQDVGSHVSLHSPLSLGELLRQQTLSSSLPALLRYEDRNSMAWSIEARVPFLDYRLVEFLAGLPDELKLRRGRTKIILREALSGLLPDVVRDRRDKMGFVTPEEVWLTRTGREWFEREIDRSIERADSLVNGAMLRSEIGRIIEGERPFSFLPWRLVCLGRWLRMQEDSVPAPPEEFAGAQTA